MSDTNKTWVKCKEGWISYSPVRGGGYYITASGHRAMTVSSLELRGVLAELTNALGGKVLNQRAA